MEKLYCPECGNYLMAGDGHCHDCPCGWKQERHMESDVDEIESLRQQLAECQRERDAIWESYKDCRTAHDAVTKERDELVMILKWVDKYVSCAISPEINAALAKLGAYKEVGK